MTEEDDFRYWVLFNMRKPLKDNCITSQLLANDERRFVEWPSPRGVPGKRSFYYNYYRNKGFNHNVERAWFHMKFAYGSYVDD